MGTLDPATMPVAAELGLPPTMTAVRWWARGDVRVDQVPTPTSIRPGWALIEVLACGICGTDLEEYLNGPIVVPDTPHPLTGGQAPLALGHEAVGGILQTDDPAAPAAGTLVAVEGNVGCGTCWWCRHHQIPLCEQLASLGQMGDGGLADYLVAPVSTCVPVPAGITPDRAVLVEPLSVVCRALRRRAGELTGARLTVLGAGTVGLLALQAALALGAAEVSVIDPSSDRLQLAGRLGATRCATPDGADRLAAEHPAAGPDVVLECAGTLAAAQSAIGLVRRGGTVILLGVHDSELRINQLDFVLGELTLTSSLSHVYDEDFPAAMELIAAGAIDTDALITARIPLSRTVTDGFEALRGPQRNAQGKMVVVPDRIPA